jgi:hypothetical protein
LRLSPVSRTIAEIVPQSKGLPRTSASSKRFGPAWRVKIWSHNQRFFAVQGLNCRKRGLKVIAANFFKGARHGDTDHRKLKKLRCQVPQVDITELSDFLTVAQALYSLYSFLANNDDRPTSL